ncbi:hypothetical protein AX774_g6419 [Zancudomyces culisetae]|uniref:Uncharacterized protein n=1 Tax=Zancudomyces culisetae TaxID=1213189 RepID=A0A1R1PGP6_ZANCU|nr:hypothetical protein AX774_g6419 [Zancudomyces culisetae]|eukprot:OMH80151.1 hypothetical protein AX774_g6419 [Zancudomyces culisetae]
MLTISANAVPVPMRGTNVSVNARLEIIPFPVSESVITRKTSVTQIFQRPMKPRYSVSGLGNASILNKNLKSPRGGSLDRRRFINKPDHRIFADKLKNIEGNVSTTNSGSNAAVSDDSSIGTGSVHDIMVAGTPILNLDHDSNANDEANDEANDDADSNNDSDGTQEYIED